MNTSEMEFVVQFKQGKYPKKRGDCQFITPGEKIF